MKIINKLKAAGVVLLLTAGILAVVATPAQAIFSDCPNDDVCVFDNAGGYGYQYNFGSNVYPGCVNNGRATLTSSAANRRYGTRVKFYSSSNCFLPGEGFVSVWVYSGQNINFGWGMDNHVYSFRWEHV